MSDFLKRNMITLLVVVATIVLAGIALFTALRLYQLRQTTVAPNAPTSQPGAAVGAACQALSFTLATPTPTPTPAPGCYGTCTTPGTQSNCPTGMTCQTVGGQNLCVNPSCSSNSNCICATATPTPTPTMTPTSTPSSTITPTPVSTSTPTPIAQATPIPTTTPSLPIAGVGTPTIILLAVGTLLVIGALVLVF